MPDPTVCAYHRTGLRTLKHLLGRAHQGHRTARRALAAIAKQCPACLKEKP